MVERRGREHSTKSVQPKDVVWHDRQRSDGAWHLEEEDWDILFHVS